MDRAQLLSGLRTGGPRSASYNVPQSATPGGSFHRQYDTIDDAADMFAGLGLNGNGMSPAQQQQALLQAQLQQQMMAAGFGGNMSVNQAMQMQMELMRLQALQQQQNIQAQLMLQNQLQVAQQQLNRRRSENHIIPSTAGPTQSTFADLAQQTRSNAAATLRARAINRENSPVSISPPNGSDDHQIPMSAALGGKFGSRGGATGPTSVSPLNPHAAAFVGRFHPEAINTNLNSFTGGDAPQTPTYSVTTVISGGTPLGGLIGPGSGPNTSGNSTPTTSYNGLSGYNNSTSTGPSKSDSALSWRRGSSTGPATPVTSKPPSPPIGSGRATSGSPIVGTSPFGRLNTSNSGFSSLGSDSPAPSPLRTRPQPLRFTNSNTVSLSDRTSENGDEVIAANGGGDNTSGSTKSADSPTESSPPTSAGSGGREREEASKRLYEGLGLGRPQPQAQSVTNAPTFNLNSSAPVFKPQLPPPRALSLNTVSIPTLSMTGPTPTTATGMGVPGTRFLSQPVRQPRGPPGSVDELGAKNFAMRVRKKALGGLGALMDARAERNSGVVGVDDGIDGLHGLEGVIAY